MLYDILMDTPAFKDIAKREHERALRELREEFEENFKKEREEDLAKSFAQGIEKASQEHLEATRQTVIKIVSARFPKTKAVSLARRVVQLMDNEEALQDMMVKLSLAQTSEEAQDHLLNWLESDEDGEEHN